MFLYARSRCDISVSWLADSPPKLSNTQSSDRLSSAFKKSFAELSPAVIKSAGISEVDFDGLLSPPLRLHEDLKNGCGGQLWPAGMVLGKYMLRMKKEDLVGKSMYVS